MAAMRLTCRNHDGGPTYARGPPLRVAGYSKERTVMPEKVAGLPSV